MNSPDEEIQRAMSEEPFAQKLLSSSSWSVPPPGTWMWFNNIRRSLNPVPWGFLWKLCQRGMINHNLNFQYLSPLQRTGGGAQSSNLLIICWFSW